MTLRISVCLAFLLCLTSCISSGEQPFPGEPISFDRNEVCLSPGQSPVCAVKTLEACRSIAGTPGPCKAIGVNAPGVEVDVTNLDAKDPGPEPWRLTWDELSALERSCGYSIVAVEKVRPRRFDATPPIADALKGTHELVLIDNGCYDSVSVVSAFLKKGEAGWLITSYDQRYEAAYPPEIYGLEGDDLFYDNWCDPPRIMDGDHDICSIRPMGITQRTVPLPDNMPVVPKGTRELTAEEEAKTCRTQVGERLANIYTIRCKMMASGNRPRCHPLESCDIIFEQIARGCALIEFAERPSFCGNAR